MHGTFREENHIEGMKNLFMVDNKNIECVPVLDASNIIQDNHRPQVPANRSLADYELVSTSGCSGYIVAHAVNLDKHLTGRGNDFLRGTVRIFHPEFGVSTLHTSLSTVTWPQSKQHNVHWITYRQVYPHLAQSPCKPTIPSTVSGLVSSLAIYESTQSPTKRGL